MIIYKWKHMELPDFIKYIVILDDCKTKITIQYNNIINTQTMSNSYIEYFNKDAHNKDWIKLDLASQEAQILKLELL